MTVVAFGHQVITVSLLIAFLTRFLLLKFLWFIFNSRTYFPFRTLSLRQFQVAGTKSERQKLVLLSRKKIEKFKSSTVFYLWLLKGFALLLCELKSLHAELSRADDNDGIQHASTLFLVHLRTIYGFTVDVYGSIQAVIYTKDLHSNRGSQWFVINSIEFGWTIMQNVRVRTRSAAQEFTAICWLLIAINVVFDSGQHKTS